MTTLRRADQVLSFSNIEPVRTAAPRPNELKWAEQRVASIDADFDPVLWQNEYCKRLCELIEAKSKSKTITPPALRKKASRADLADALRTGIAHAKEKKVA
jgi:non-homologous end joining protein Ku